MKAPYKRDAATRLTTPSAVRFDGGDGLTVEATIASSTLLSDGLALDLAGADLSRVERGACPLIVDHKNAARGVVGAVSNVRVDGDTLKATLQITDPGIRDQVKRGDPLNVSIGFNVTEQVGTVARKWELTEVSLVAVGLDPAAGIQRDADAERTRTARLAQIAADFNAGDLLASAISTGQTPDQFEAAIRARRPMTRAAPAVLRTVGDPEEFLLVRMIRDQMNGNRGPEIERCGDAQTQGGRAHGGLNIPEEAMRSMRVRSQRALDTGAASTGDHLVGLDHADAQFIEALRGMPFAAALGCRVLDGLEGDLSIPRQSGTVTAAWVNEGTDVLAPADQALDDIELSPKEAGAATEYTRKLMLQSAPSVEMMVREDLIAVLDRAVEIALLVGTGQNNQPAGLTSFDAALFAQHEDGANGTTMDYAKAVAMLQAIAQANANASRAVWLTAPVVAGKLMVTPKIATEPVYLMEDGMMVGKRVVETTLAPSGVAKGSATKTGLLVIGDWSEAIIGRWSAIDILTNPYSLDTTRKIRVTAYCDVDVDFRHLKSFAVNESVVHD